MKLQRKGMKRLLVLHMITASIWLGSVVAMWAFAYILFFRSTQEEFMLVAHWLPTIYLTVVFPASVITVIEGLIYGFFTNWGFAKYRWILLKWVLAIMVGIASMAGVVVQSRRIIDNIHQQGFVGGFADGGLILGIITFQIIVLIIIIMVSVYKPKLKRK